MAPTGRHSLSRCVGSALLQRQTNSESKKDRAHHAALPSANATMAAQPSADWCCCQSDQTCVTSAHDREHEPKRRELQRHGFMLWMNELRQECQKEQSGIRDEKFSQNCL